jgi:hypothetical protein
MDKKPLINKYDDYLTLFQDAKNNNDYNEYIKYLSIIKRYKTQKNKTSL